MRQTRTAHAPTQTPTSATPMLRDLWNEVFATGLFEVSAGERFVEHMLDRLERHP